MSSTIITDRSVIFLGDYVVLFQKTFESNCFPQVPHWNCGHVGTYESAMRWILSGAAAVYDGLLEDRMSNNTALGYVQKWYDAMRVPQSFAEETVKITFGTGHYDIPQSSYNAFIEATDLPVKNGKAILDLKDNEAVSKVVHAIRSGSINALYGWRVFKSGMLMHASGHCPINFNPTKVPLPFDVFIMPYRDYPSQDVYLVGKGNQLAAYGSETRAVGEMFSLLVPHELQYPGSAAMLITACFFAMNEAATVSESTQFTLALDEAADRYIKEDFVELKGALGGKLQASLAELKASKKSYLLSRLPANMVSYSLAV